MYSIMAHIWYILTLLATALSLLLCWDKADPLEIDDFVYATVTAGRLRGFKARTNANGPTAYVFKRIPYAEPPVGALRFEPLRPPVPRHGELDATQYSAACMSNTTRTTSPQWPISEDCIYINVFTSPSCMKGSKRDHCPVLFYIHGGNFLYDSAVMFNDRQIVDKYAADDIVFVVAGYRIGVFGFADLGSDKIIRRNNGFYDIAFALRWTIAEIGVFGGDPKRITVMGNSGGANAIAYLMAARSTVTVSGRPLFAQAVLSSIAPDFSRDLNVQVTRELLETFGCLPRNATSATSRQLRAAADCLRAVDATALIDAQAAVESRGFFFKGVTASADFPADSFVNLFELMRPTRMIITTTVLEFHDINSTKYFDEECLKYSSVFDYTTQHVHDACVALYGDPANYGIRRLAAESLHAEADALATANRRRGGTSYRGSFQLANHSQHSDDLLFFVGLHWVRNATLTKAERLMDIYYPAMIKRFLREGRPDDNWKPISADGRSYFVLDFQVDHGAVRMRPYHVPNTYVDPKADKFWLKDAAAIEKRWRLSEAGLNASKDFTSKKCRGLDNYWSLCDWWPIRMWCGVRSVGQRCFQSQTIAINSTPTNGENGKSELEQVRGVAFYTVSGVSVMVVVGVIISILVIIIRRKSAASEQKPTERTPLTQRQGR